MEVCSTEGSSNVLGACREQSRAVAFDAELQRKVIAFNAGDEKYAGDWLTQFQRSQGAWQACVNALAAGPPDSLDEELLQEFCAQTLARLGRTFGARHPEAARADLRLELNLLLTIHSQGRPQIWRQLALALTCADLWLGSWSPEPAVSDTAFLPAALRRELLTLPTELLFCERALPLDNPKLRYAAAKALIDGCEQVFPVLLVGVDASDDCPAGEEGARLRVVASWLRALRKSLRQLPTCDAALPLRALAAQGPELLMLANAAPGEGAEVALQIARWRCSHTEVAEILRPMLEVIFSSDFAEQGRQVLLPLLSELAADCWPRAVFGDLDLPWQAITEQALAVAQDAIDTAALHSYDECAGDDIDVEASLELFRTFAVTVREGVRDQPGPPQLGDAGKAGESSRPEKRSRVGESWQPTHDRIASSEALPLLFAGFSQRLVEFLAIREDKVDQPESLAKLWGLRTIARETLEAWAVLLGGGVILEDAVRVPLTRVSQRLASCDPCNQGNDVWQEAEVVLWYSTALVSRMSCELASGVSELIALDGAPIGWRSLLWASAAGLAACAPAERMPQVIEWMLQRSPIEAGVADLMAFTELPYALALEQACSKLPGHVAHPAVGERIAMLAFAERPESALHADTAKSQSTLLLAMRHTLGSDVGLLCHGLSTAVLPRLRVAVESERMMSGGGDGDAKWLAAQALFATLAIAVPKVANGPGAPESAQLWEAHWQYLQDAVIEWVGDKSNEQPLQAAVEALKTASLAVPALIKPSVQLLSASVAKKMEQLEEVTLELKALRDIVAGAWCAVGDDAGATATAEVLGQAVLDCCDALLARPKDLLENPLVLEKMFELLAEAVRCSPPGTSGLAPCGDRLRPLLIAQPLRFTSRALELASRALAECTRGNASDAMLFFMARLPQQDITMPAHRSILLCAMPEVCKALCIALASREHLAELEHLTPAGELLFALADAFPSELLAALQTGLEHVQVTAWSRQRLASHVDKRSEWQRRSEWLEHLQQIAQEWQRELRQVTL